MRVINNSTIAGGYASASTDSSTADATSGALPVLTIDLIIVDIQWNVEISRKIIEYVKRIEIRSSETQHNNEFIVGLYANKFLNFLKF